MRAIPNRLAGAWSVQPAAAEAEGPDVHAVEKRQHFWAAGGDEPRARGVRDESGVREEGTEVHESEAAGGGASAHSSTGGV